MTKKIDLHEAALLVGVRPSQLRMLIGFEQGPPSTQQRAPGSPYYFEESDVLAWKAAGGHLPTRKEAQARHAVIRELAELRKKRAALDRELEAVDARIADLSMVPSPPARTPSGTPDDTRTAAKQAVKTVMKRWVRATRP